jgi:AcrR family transcriptional regulator
MARGRPRQFDKDAALDIALALFWRHGYEGVSVAMLAAAMSIRIPSLYAAFGSKESLFLAAVRRYSDFAGRIYHDAFALPTAREVAHAILLGEVDLVTQPNRPNGCLMVQGALVTSPQSEKIAELMGGMRLTAEGWMEARFRRAQADGDLARDADPKALACYVMTVNSGLAVQARSGVSREQLLAVVDIAMRAWPE